MGDERNDSARDGYGIFDMARVCEMACDVDAWNVGLECLRVIDGHGTEFALNDFDSELAQQSEVRIVAYEYEDGIIGKRDNLAVFAAYANLAGKYL